MGKLEILELLQLLHAEFANCIERGANIDDTDIIAQLEWRYELGFIDGKIELLESLLHSINTN